MGGFHIRAQSATIKRRTARQAKASHGVQDSPSQTPGPRRSRAHRIGLWSLATSAGLGLAAALAIVLAVGQMMTAPQWLRDRIETRLETRLSGLQVEFGDIGLVINAGWRPRARLRDVTLSDAAGRPLLRLSEAEASLAMRPLLRGQIQPKQIVLSGAFAILRRDTGGGITLALGDTANPLRQAQGLVSLIEGLDEAFALPLLSALTEVELRELNLRYEDAVSGRAWTLDSGSLRLTRDGDDLRMSGDFGLLSGRAYASVIEVNYASTIGEVAAEFGITLRDVPTRDFASQAVALAWLDVLRAPMSGALRGSVTEDGALGPLNVALTIGPGVLQPSDGTTPVPFRTARTYLTFEPGDQTITFDELSVQSDWVGFVAEGETYLGGIDGGRLDDLIGQMRVTEISLNPLGLYDTPVSLTGAQADFRLKLDPFDFRLGQLWIDDRGSRILLDGRLTGAADGWNVALNGEIDALTPERLIELWPEGAVPNTRDWIAQNLSGGTLSDMNIALRRAPGQAPQAYLDFDYAGSQINFMRTMPPITGAAGQASLIGNRFVTTAIRGEVLPEDGGPVDVSGTSFIIPDVTARGATPAIVRLMGRGSVTSVLSLLNRPPLAILDPAGLPVTLADGRIVFDGTLALPLQERVDIADVDFHVDGLASDVRSDVLVPGHVLDAPQVRVSATDTGVSLSADGRLSGVPVQAVWTQALGTPGAGSRAEGRIALTADALAALRIGLPPGMVGGAGTARFDLAIGGGQAPRLRVDSDLTGVRLALPELGWAKAADAGGALSVTATLGPDPQVETLSLSAPGLSAEGTIRLSPDGGLGEAAFTTFRVGDWLDAQGSLIGRGPGNAPAIRVTGGMLDLRRAVFAAPSGGNAPRGGDALVARLDRLQVTDTIALTGFEGRFALSGGLDGSFAARVNGDAPITGRVVPQAGRSAVRILSDDAGGVARSAAILRQAAGGDFAMTLVPVGAAGTFDGTVTVRDTYVRDAPAMAALLNAISVVGLLTELSGQGILFSEVEARFRLTPDSLRVIEARATGPSLGLTMDGLYDVTSRQLAMQGVISPVYLLNQIGGVLAPRRGEGLFGFNYTLSGPADAPSVLVNPLSGLAPGFFREIFRAPDPGAAATSGTAPESRSRDTPGDDR